MSTILGAHHAIGRVVAQRKSTATSYRLSMHAPVRSLHSSAVAQSTLSSVQQSILKSNAATKTNLGSLKPMAGSKKPVRLTVASNRLFITYL